MNGRCQSCQNKIVQKSSSGIKIRTQGALTIDESGNCTGQCYWCKALVSIPLELAKSFELPTERLFIVERGKLPERK